MDGLDRFRGRGSAFPTLPVNAVVIDPVAQIVYVGTDVGGIPKSSTSSAELGEGLVAQRDLCLALPLPP